MIGNDPQRVTSFRQQDPPSQTAASLLYRNVVAQEYKTQKNVLHAANKGSEVNAFNMPLTPAMVVRVYPSLKEPRMTSRLLSKPIMLLKGGGNVG